MENKENPPAAASIAATAAAEASFSGPLFPTSPPSAASFPPVSPVVFSPCAACKILRRRCVEKCVLAPYFPPTDPMKFTIAHRVFGASNIIKLLQELPESQRADAVSSIVYEANARLRDPVYGCAGAICLLQKQINELQIELAKAQADILNFKCQNENLLELIISEHHEMIVNENQKLQEFLPQDPIIIPYVESSALFLDENILGVAWEPLYGHELF